jgi:F-type H+-transporting ATPase subunit gamma
VRMVFPTWAAGGGLKVTHKNLLPLDNSHFPKAADVVPRPMIQLPLPELLERLGQEYVFAQICEAAAESFAAENQARVATMAAASSNIDAKLTALRSQERLTRQQEITAEVIELAASARSHRIA